MNVARGAGRGVVVLHRELHVRGLAVHQHVRLAADPVAALVERLVTPFPGEGVVSEDVVVRIAYAEREDVAGRGVVHLVQEGDGRRGVRGADGEQGLLLDPQLVLLVVFQVLRVHVREVAPDGDVLRPGRGVVDEDLVVRDVGHPLQGFLHRDHALGRGTQVDQLLAGVGACEVRVGPVDAGV